MVKQTAETHDDPIEAAVQAASRPGALLLPWAQLPGQPAYKLLVGERYGPALARLAASPARECMLTFFNRARELTTAEDGSLMSALDGSHADGFVTGIVVARPSGEVFLLLECDLDNRQDVATLLTSTPVASPISESVRQLLARKPADAEIDRFDGQIWQRAAKLRDVLSIAPTE